ncbi:MAG: hypothetical protein Ta2A_18340 [Treponemataceae bacterium]|nr:MAG: hypothetical protein Ta2A_18340 [Treponemataceae bacterium]
MKYLLFGGAQSVGKSETIWRLGLFLCSTKHFKIVVGSIPATFTDFKAILEGVDHSGKQVRIAINSGTDTPDIILSFKKFCDSSGIYDIIISSIRDHDFHPRSYFIKTMGITSEDFVLEIPLAKITRKNGSRIIALTWYKG